MKPKKILPRLHAQCVRERNCLALHRRFEWQRVIIRLRRTVTELHTIDREVAREQPRIDRRTRIFRVQFNRAATVA